MPTDELSLLILQPTPFCNLDCDYCYLGTRGQRRRMSLSLVATIARRVAESGRLGQRLTVVWHGGEPLVVPVVFYRRALALFEAALPRETTLRFAFQTNATLIDEAWCELFADPRIRVGVSIDGPASLHDAHRKTRDGRGSLAATLAGIGQLHRADIPFTVITVLTADTLNHADELLDFYVEHGIEWVGFNIEEVEGAHAASSLAGADIPARFRAFLTRLLRLSHARCWPVHLREFEQLIAHLSHHRDGVDNDQTTALRIMTVDWQGHTGTFSPELPLVGSDGRRGFAIGDIGRQSLATMVAGDALREIADEVAAGVTRCRRECGYFAYCGGGAPANKWFENGSLASTETLYCRLMRKAIVDVTLDQIECFANLLSAKSKHSAAPADVKPTM